MKPLKYTVYYSSFYVEDLEGGREGVRCNRGRITLACFRTKRPTNLHSYLVTSLPQFLFLYSFKQYSVVKLDIYTKSALTNNSHCRVEVPLVITLSRNLNIIFNDFCPLFFLVSLEQTGY